MDDTSLSHHGILGMKWGIRRFQRKDGSLTSEGKRRRKGDSEEKHEETSEERRARVLKSTNASEIYKNRDILSTDEIRERLDRINVENQLRSVAESTKKSGIDKINEIADKFKKVDSIYSTVSNSTIGKKILKDLGLEAPTKEFNLDNVWENRNKLSTKDIKDVSERIFAEQKIENELNRRHKKAEEEKAKEEKAKKKKANKKATKDDKKDTKNTEEIKNDKQPENEETRSYTGEVHGEGTSRFTWEKQGRDYVDAEFTEDSSSDTRRHMNEGQRYIDQLLLEDNRGGR